jgi:hypothetical protein
MTAAGVEAWLKETGQYAALEERKRQQEEEWQQLEAEHRRAEAPLVDELRAEGFDVQSAWDLVSSPSSYPNAVPILLAHLPRPYPAAVREGIARALAVPEACGGWQALARLYRDEVDVRVKDGLAVALAGAASNHMIGELVSLARDKAQGPSRVLLLSALERSTDRRARAALMDLSADPDLAPEVHAILRRLKAAKR